MNRRIIPFEKRKRLNRKNWLKGFCIDSNGNFEIIVDHIFNDRGKMREDDLYLSKEAFRKNFLDKFTKL